MRGGTYPEEQHEHGKADAGEADIGNPGVLPVGQLLLQQLQKLLGLGQLRLLRQHEPGATTNKSQHEADEAPETRPAPLAAGPPDLGLVRGIDVRGLLQVFNGGLIGADLCFQGILSVFQLHQVAFLEIHLVQLLAQGLRLGVQFLAHFIELGDLFLEAGRHVFQGRHPGHGLHRHAVGMRRGDLPLGEVEGLHELVELVAEDLEQLVRHALHAPGQGVVHVVHPAQAGAVVAVPIQETRQLVVHAAYGEFQHHGTMVFPPAQYLVQVIRPQGKGTAEQGETHSLADGALARLILAADGDDALLRNIVQLQGSVFEDVFRLY